MSVSRSPTKNANKGNNDIITKEWMESFMKTNLSRIEQRLETFESKIESAIKTKLESLESEISSLKERNTELEHKLEKLDRGQRRFNIKISKLSVSKDEVQKVISDALVAQGKPPAKIKNILEIKTKDGLSKFIGTCDSSEDKTRIMGIKKQLTYKGKPYYINEDLTPKEEEIQFKLRRFADSLGPRESTAVAYKRVYNMGKCYIYNDETQQIEITEDFPHRP